MTEIKVITGVERRKRWSLEEKQHMVEESYRPGSSVSQVARNYGITPSQLFYWRRLMEAGALQGISTEEELVPKSQVKELEKRVRELERLLGRKTVEVEILKEGLELAEKKKLISRQPLPKLGNILSEL